MTLPDRIKKNISIENLKSSFGLVACPILMGAGSIFFYKSLAMLSGLAFNAKDDIDPVKSISLFFGGIALITIGGIGYGHEMLKAPNPVNTPPDANGPS